MDKNRVAKTEYHAPCMEVLPIKVEHLLAPTSPVGGGHKDAPDAPGLSAKRGRLFLDEDESGWPEGHSLWE